MTVSVFCEHCGRDFVIPVSWFDLDEERWSIRLRCGECGAWREVRVTNAEAKDFDLTLDRQTAQIRSALDRIDHERMHAECAAFLGALQRDLIDAADFAR